MEISTRGMNYRVTNMINVHTCIASRPNLVGPIVPVVHRQLVELASNMVCHPCIGVPDGITGTMGGRCSCNTSVGDGEEINVEGTGDHRVSCLEAKLALLLLVFSPAGVAVAVGTRVETGIAGVGATISTPASVATTSAATTVVATASAATTIVGR